MPSQVHGQARRLFGLHLAAVVPDRSVGSRKERSALRAAAVQKMEKMFLLRARMMWRRWSISLRRKCSGKMWKVFFRAGSLPLRPTQGLGPILQRNALRSPERDQLERLETSGSAVQSFVQRFSSAEVEVAQQQDALRALGWQVVSSSPEVASHGLGSRWVLQDCTDACYQYDSDVYVWPRCRKIGKSSHMVPEEHMKIFQAFLAEYSGICNFNYKALLIFRLESLVLCDRSLLCDKGSLEDKSSTGPRER
eukprot:Skav236396  [mRNA]  locus=scaffold29:316750:319641:+ [translate_table: standard]